MKPFYKLGLAVALSGLSQFSVALDYYTGVDATYLSSRVDSAKFNPIAVGGRLGVYLQPQLGLELHGMVGVDSDEDIDIELDLNRSVGLALRFETPEAQGGKIYFLFGYATSELEMQRSGTALPGAETFDGGTFGGGAEFRLGNSDRSFLNLQMIRYYQDKGITLDAISLGIRFRL